MDLKFLQKGFNMNLIKNDNNEGWSVVGVKGRRKLWDSSLEFQGQFELAGPSIVQRYDIPDRAGLSWVSIMSAIFYCQGILTAANGKLACLHFRTSTD